MAASNEGFLDLRELRAKHEKGIRVSLIAVRHADRLSDISRSSLNRMICLVWGPHLWRPALGAFLRLRHVVSMRSLRTQRIAIQHPHCSARTPRTASGTPGPPVLGPVFRGL
jgi:hypothetical protein